MKKLFGFIFLFGIVCSFMTAQSVSHSFKLGGDEFLLDGKPYQIISGEIHPARIPAEYWRHRIQMAKAMGCNTIAAYIFWNYHEVSEGKFDFSTWNKNLVKFLKIAQEEGMWVLFRPGPYVCAEWEFGGIPPYLLRIPDIKVRCMDERYIKSVKRYIARLAKEIKPLLITNGGPILMVQIENEYGSFGNDRNYMFALKKMWEESGINVPFFTADGGTTYMLEAGSLPGCAVGLDPAGAGPDGFNLAKKINPGVPVFSSETYPGWLTHWGEKWNRPDTAELLKEVKYLLDNKKSLNLYVVHGGTNFGYTAGANSGYKGYEPDLTSYDYDAPINEQGEATPKYFALRNLIGKYIDKPLPQVPDKIPMVEIPEIEMKSFTTVWNNLPKPKASVQPKTFEAYGQDYGFILYKAKLIGHKSGKLTVTNIHDYATVFLNGEYVGILDRREAKDTITLPKSNEKDPVLEILVEGMGRINFAQAMIDRKGITDRVTLNGMTLMNWEVYNLPMDEKYISSLKPGNLIEKPGRFFKGNFNLNETGDTYFDMQNYKKCIVWVNGHNLGRYWDIGPQKRLYCPACWLKKDGNEIIIFDLLQAEAGGVKGMKSLE